MVLLVEMAVPKDIQDHLLSLNSCQAIPDFLEPLYDNEVLSHARQEEITQMYPKTKDPQQKLAKDPQQKLAKDPQQKLAGKFWPKYREYFHVDLRSDENIDSIQNTMSRARTNRKVNLRQQEQVVPQGELTVVSLDEEGDAGEIGNVVRIDEDDTHDKGDEISMFYRFTKVAF
jgi:hypothetical protein